MSGDADQPWLVDTSIVVHVLRATPLGRHIVAAHQLRARPDAAMVSIVTVGELLSLTRQLGWGEKRVALMKELLGEMVVVDINSQPVLDAYAEIDAWCRQNGRNLGKNDVWIAATAAVTRAALVTADKDFVALHDHFMRVLYFDPAAPLPSGV
jgi:tRNA(fMet)-specific endonuclease VapC